jgi:hypothetical protein
MAFSLPRTSTRYLIAASFFFANDGTMVVSAQIADELKQFNLANKLQTGPTNAERQFLAYHRRYVFEA